MTIRMRDDYAIPRDMALSNTWRNRIVAFGPIAVALVGIGIMAASGPREGATLVGSAPGVDPVITGTVAAD